jgi:hypothetical protein
MFTYPEAPVSSERSAEIGPPPYYHRSDCNICRQQDGLKTGSELLDAPRPASHITAEAMSRKIRAELEPS